MKFYYSLLVFLFGCLSCLAQPCKTVVGYYPSWQWYKRSKLVKPETIKYENYSHLNYAFFKPLSDGNIILGDEWGDENLLLGEYNSSLSPPFDWNKSIVKNAHDNDVMILISVGGGSWSHDFSTIAASQITRSTFAHNCRQIVQTYKVDGIDIDWEYPGYPGSGGSLADKDNFNLLISEVRDSLDQISTNLGNTPLLSAAFGVSPTRMEDIDWGFLDQKLDFFNLMTYDYFGLWSEFTNHNSPNYPPTEGASIYCIESTIDFLKQNHPFLDWGKFNLGIPFYGRSFKTPSSPFLHGPHTGLSDDISFPEGYGNPPFWEIDSQIHQFEEQWDSISKASYLLGKNGLNTFVSFDNKNSISEKTKLVKLNGFGGVVCWEITGEYIETFPGSGIIESTPLSDHINQSLCDTSPVSLGFSPEPELIIFPNPAGERVYIRFSRKSNPRELEIYSLDGKKIFQKKLHNNDPIELKTEGFSRGYYFFKILTDKRVLSESVFFTK